MFLNPASAESPVAVIVVASVISVVIVVIAVSMLITVLIYMRKRTHSDTVMKNTAKCMLNIYNLCCVWS